MTSPAPSSGRDRLDLLAGLALPAALGLAAFIWRYGPAGPLPMHFDFHGRIDGWGDRVSVAVLVAMTSLVLALCYGLMLAMTRSLPPDAPGRRGLKAARLVMVLVGLMICSIGAAMAYGDFSAPDSTGWRIMPGLLALLFLLVGAVVGKTAPNPFVGVRFYWALKSRLAWDKSNRLMGRLLFWIGLGGLVADLFADPGLVTAGLIVAVLAAGAVSVFESWRVWRTDPDRSLP